MRFRERRFMRRMAMAGALPRFFDINSVGCDGNDDDTDPDEDRQGQGAELPYDEPDQGDDLIPVLPDGSEESPVPSDALV